MSARVGSARVSVGRGAWAGAAHSDTATDATAKRLGVKKSDVLDVTGAGAGAGASVAVRVALAETQNDADANLALEEAAPAEPDRFYDADC